MEKIEIKNRIEKILVNILKHHQFEMQDDLTASDVDGWDSLTHMMIISEIEKEFGVKFKLRDLNKLTNMGSLIELINQK
jgi:acyl carrier protein